MSKFAQLVEKLKKQGKSEEQAKGLAAKIGREKFGAARMAKASKLGKPAAKVKV